MTSRAQVTASVASSHAFDKIDLLVSVIRRSQQMSRPEDVKWWLRADARHMLPHGALVVAWGDFPSGEVTVRRFVHEPAWSPEGVRACADAVDATVQTLQTLHGNWVAADSQPYVLPLQPEFACNLVAPGATSAPNWPVSHGLTHAVVHGVRDRRSDYDCLYVFLGSASLAMATHQESARLLVPCLETALRRAIVGTESPGGAPAGIKPLSQREREIIRWVQEGKTNEEIGLIVGISSCTVKNHLQRIFKKLNVSNRAQAAIRCRHLVFAERVD